MMRHDVMRPEACSSFATFSRALASTASEWSRLRKVISRGISVVMRVLHEPWHPKTGVEKSLNDIPRGCIEADQSAASADVATSHACPNIGRASCRERVGPYV